MKKIFTVILALFAIIAFTSASYAANTVQVTLTSPTITKTGCEKAGAVTFQFDPGSVITVGDYWYMDLPENITFCKAINYVIVRGDGHNGSGTVRISATDADFGFFSRSDLGIFAIGTDNVGPITGVNDGATGSPSNSAVTAGNIALLVKAASGQRRLYVYAIGADATPANNKITVRNNHKMNIKILDGKEWNAVAGTASSNTLILTDTDGDLTYGEGSGTSRQIIDAAGTAAEPAVENTLCLNAESLSGSYVYVSFASKSDKFTFTGDSQIAHTGSTSPISLSNCKGLTTGDILIAGQGSCSFAYESTVSGYCTGTGLFAGNRILINTTSSFGDTGDKFDVKIASTTAGTYFGAAPSVKAFLSTQDQCTATGTTLGGTWVKYVGTSLYTGSYPGTTCAVTSSTRVDTVTTTGGSFTLDNYDDLHVDLPTMVYDTTVVGSGTAATLKVTLEKYPCGEMFTGTVTIGTYVTACSGTSSTTTTLYIPFLTPMDGSLAPWWAGFVITNHSSAAGTATLTFNGTDGSQATYTTSSIAAGGQFNSATISVSDLTQVTGTFGSTNYSINVSCAFGMGRAFVFMGNGEEGTGYVIDN